MQPLPEGLQWQSDVPHGEPGVGSQFLSCPDLLGCTPGNNQECCTKQHGAYLFPIHTYIASHCGAWGSAACLRGFSFWICFNCMSQNDSPSDLFYSLHSISLKVPRFHSSDSSDLNVYQPIWGLLSACVWVPWRNLICPFPYLLKFNGCVTSRVWYVSQAFSFLNHWKLEKQNLLIKNDGESTEQSVGDGKGLP